ncbi:MAG TPA: hypothetical protein PLL71_05345 [Agriterribacter sp.]|nr:hypothetical protein [Agriterribacter sp.]HRQ50206.1 hypothetical protein [Agriterribacter sp.]
MDIYTPENMIRFLYKETSAEETAAMQLALEADWTLREKFEVLRRAIEGLNTIHQSPRPSAIQSLLRYAGVSKEVEQH